MSLPTESDFIEPGSPTGIDLTFLMDQPQVADTTALQAGLKTLFEE